jgi:hypothetical protein
MLTYAGVAAALVMGRRGPTRVESALARPETEN